jgi:hypothetical protein
MMSFFILKYIALIRELLAILYYAQQKAKLRLAWKDDHVPNHVRALLNLYHAQYHSVKRLVPGSSNVTYMSLP